MSSSPDDMPADPPERDGDPELEGDSERHDVPEPHDTLEVRSDANGTEVSSSEPRAAATTPPVNTPLRRLALLTVALLVLGVGFLSGFFGGAPSSATAFSSGSGFGWVLPRDYYSDFATDGYSLGQALAARATLLGLGMLLLAAVGCILLVTFAAWRSDRRERGILTAHPVPALPVSTAARPLNWFAGALTVLGLWLLVAGLADETSRSGSYTEIVEVTWWYLFLPRAVGTSVVVFALAVVAVQASLSFGAWRHDVRTARA